MKVYLEEDELYPFYHLIEQEPDDAPDRCVVGVDVRPETVARWKATMDAFKEMQGEMRYVYCCRVEKAKP